MNFEQLLVFIKIAETGSYHKAAQALYRSQPALTQSIKKLEESLGVTLFTRDTYRPELTPAGQIFIKEARTVVSAMQRLKILGHELGEGVEARVAIALDIICPAKAILQCAQRVLLRESPYTELFMCTEVLAGGRERLLNHEVDFAIMPMHTPHRELIFEPLTRITKVPVCSPNFIAKKTVTEQDLLGLRQIVLTDSAKKIEKLTRSVIEDAKQWTVTDIYLKKEMIMEGLGWGYLPLHMVDTEIKEGALNQLQVNGKKESDIDICLIRHDDHPMGPIARAIWDGLKEAFS